MKKNKLFFLLVTSMLSLGAMAGCSTPDNPPSDSKVSDVSNPSTVSTEDSKDPSSPSTDASQPSNSGTNSDHSVSNSQPSNSENRPSNSQGNASNSQNSQGGNSQQGESYPGLGLDVQANLNDLIKNKGGFLVEVVSTEKNESMTMKVGYVGNSRWFAMDDGQYGFRAEKDYDAVFNYDTEWKFIYAVKDSSMLSSFADEFLGQAAIGLTQANADLTTKKAVKQAGRDATQYSITYEGETCVAVLDNEIGVILKLVADGYSFEVKSLTFKPVVPFASITVPSDVTVYDDIPAAIQGIAEANKIKTKFPKNMALTYKTYSVGDSKVWTYNFAKVDEDYVYYYKNGNGRITAESVLEGKYSKTEYVVSGKTNKNYWNPKNQDITDEAYASNLDACIGAPSNFYSILADKEHAKRDASKDKVICGINCEAYIYSAQIAGISSSSEIYLDPQTNIIFYATSSVLMSDGETRSAVNIEVTHYDTSITSLYDFACESLFYRDNGSDVSNDIHHSYGEEVVLKEANCTEQGKKGQICKYCELQKQTGTIDVDPTKHVPQKDYSDDYQGNHVKYCEMCWQVVESAPHQFDEADKHPTCSGYATVKCNVCGIEIETEVEKSAEHTYSLKNYELGSYYIGPDDLDTDITITFYCDCYYSGSGSDHGAPKTWNLPKLNNEEFWSKRVSYGTPTYTWKKELLIRSLKAVWPNESDEALGQFLETALYNLGIYNGSITIY